MGVLNSEELKETDLLAEEIAEAAIPLNQDITADHVTLDNTSKGWLSCVEKEGKVLFSGECIESDWRAAMKSLKTNIQKLSNT